MIYKYGLLRRDISPEADRHNAEWLGSQTLGIEVTAESLAKRCGLGNIDLQHQAGGGSSAIEEALTHELPIAGSRLVTIRPDKDSLGAMAVLSLRAEGLGYRIDRALVAWIGALDRQGYNAKSTDPHLSSMFSDSTVTDALNVICLDKRPWPLLTTKVDLVRLILTGEMRADEIRRISEINPKVQVDFAVEMRGGVAFIKAPGAFDQARCWANRRYRVAVVYDEHHPSHGGLIKKWSVVRQKGSFDRWGFERSINSAEAEARGALPSDLKMAGLCWGGNENIVSSPQGVGRESVLSAETVLRLVRKHYESGVVS